METGIGFLFDRHMIRNAIGA